MKIIITKAEKYDAYNVGDICKSVDVNVKEKIINKSLLFVEDHIGRIFGIPYGHYKIM